VRQKSGPMGEIQEGNASRIAGSQTTRSRVRWQKKSKLPAYKGKIRARHLAGSPEEIKKGAVPLRNRIKEKRGTGSIGGKKK